MFYFNNVTAFQDQLKEIENLQEKLNTEIGPLWRHYNMHKSLINRYSICSVHNTPPNLYGNRGVEFHDPIYLSEFN